MLVLGAEQQESELGDWREGYVENLSLESNSAASVIGVLTSCDSLTHAISAVDAAGSQPAHQSSVTSSIVSFTNNAIESFRLLTTRSPRIPAAYSLRTGLGSSGGRSGTPNKSRKVLLVHFR